MRSATDTTVLIEQVGLENRVRFDRVTKMPRGPGDTVTPAISTEPDADVAMPGAEYVADRIIGHRTARGGVEYKVRWYGYTAREYTYEALDGLPPPFTDRYWHMRKQRRAARA